MTTVRLMNCLREINNCFQDRPEDAANTALPANQLVLGLLLRELAAFVAAPDLQEQCSALANQIVIENSDRLALRENRETPMNDFISRLRNPAFLASYLANPSEQLAKAGLSDVEQHWLSTSDRGLLRVRLIQELEKAGFSPLVSDKFGMSPSMIETTVMTTSTNFDTYHIDVTRETTNTTTNKQISWLRSAIEDIDSAIHYFGEPASTKRGALKVVGTGIRSIVDLSLGAEADIRAAAKVIYCVADPVTERQIHRLNPNAESLYRLYGNDKPRIETYQEMVSVILGYVRMGLSVCAVFYGHPGVFAWSTHEAIRQARKEGYRAEMSPAISAEASLLADLGLDPSTFGMQSLEATDFLIRRRTIDTSCHVLLWQVECVGDFGFNFAGYKKQNFPILVESLQAIYPKDHPVVVYDGSQLPQFRPKLQKLSLSTISVEHLSGISTLYLPPVMTPDVDADMCRRLGLDLPWQLQAEGT
ncbi:SAM-dependent methyltransferase [Duganella sp. S19_KUP01_CR8]|uniref:SAM-dependent methyltransferase n=1 Tax=Duganella sp. S19_KUP01_CR8 TaxID=3025502 RepID=UPI002FCD795E